MSLSEKLLKRKCPSERVTIDGIEFIVTGKSLNDTAALNAKCRSSKGVLDGDKLDRELLAACVADADGVSDMTPQQWGEVPRSITGPLMTVVLNLCGLDRDDVKRSPKDSDSTES